MADVDIDLSDRNDLIKLIKCVPAMHKVKGKIKHHTTGVYVTDIPYDPEHKCATIDFKEAEARKYFKIDLLNMSVYDQVKDEAHLIELMKEPDWDLLKDREFVEKIVHIGAHYDTLINMPEPVNTIPRMAMMLAMIRPAKRHLIGKSWKEVAKTIWDKPVDGQYFFKKAHGIAYSQLVVVHMNLISNT